ncbi:MAG: hypothetical protein QXN52_10030 [Nitrososphaerota archaeon]
MERLRIEDKQIIIWEEKWQEILNRQDSILTQRLRGISQHGVDFLLINNFFNCNEPIKNELISRSSRWQHTKDFGDLIIAYSAINEKFIQEVMNRYQIDSFEEALFYLLEVVKFHDITTALFYYYPTENQDEDVILSQVINFIRRKEKINEEIFPLSELINQEVEIIQRYFPSFDQEKFLSILEDFHKETTIVGKTLRFFDWLSYTIRDWQLVNIFLDINPEDYNNLEETKKRLQNLSQVLASEAVDVLSTNQLISLINQDSIFHFFPKENLAGILIEDGNLLLDKDCQNLISEWYQKHQILREFFSGSPWARGFLKEIGNLIKEAIISKKIEIIDLFTLTEEELLQKLEISWSGIKKLFYGWIYLNPQIMKNEDSSFFIQKIRFKPLGKYISNLPPNIEESQKEESFLLYKIQLSPEIQPSLPLIRRKFPEIIPYLDKKVWWYWCRYLGNVIIQNESNCIYAFSPQGISYPFEILIVPPYLIPGLNQIVSEETENPQTQLNLLGEIVASLYQDGMLLFLSRGTGRWILRRLPQQNHQNSDRNILEIWQHGDLTKLYLQLREQTTLSKSSSPTRRRIRQITAKYPDLDIRIETLPDEISTTVYSLKENIEKIISRNNNTKTRRRNRLVDRVNFRVYESKRREMTILNIGFDIAKFPLSIYKKTTIINIGHLIPSQWEGKYDLRFPSSYLFLQEPTNEPFILLIPKEGQIWGIAIRIKSERFSFDLNQASYLFPQITFAGYQRWLGNIPELLTPEKVGQTFFYIGRLIKTMAWWNETPNFPLSPTPIWDSVLKKLNEAMLTFNKETKVENAISLFSDIYDALKGDFIKTILAILPPKEREEFKEELKKNFREEISLPLISPEEQLNLLLCFPELTLAIKELLSDKKRFLKFINEFKKLYNLSLQSKNKDYFRTITVVEFFKVLSYKNPFFFLFLLRPVWCTEEEWMEIILDEKFYEQIVKQLPYELIKQLEFPLKIHKLKEIASIIINEKFGENNPPIPISTACNSFPSSKYTARLLFLYSAVGMKIAPILPQESIYSHYPQPRVRHANRESVYNLYSWINKLASKIRQNQPYEEEIKILTDILSQFQFSNYEIEEIKKFISRKYGALISDKVVKILVEILENSKK